MSKGFFSNAEKNTYIKECLEKRLNKYGELTYIYSVLDKKNIDNMIIISNLPDEVADNYLVNKYQYVDPVVVNALNEISPFSWDENLKINSIWSVNRMFEKIKSFNIIKGHAFVLHDNNNNLAMLLFYMDKFLTDGFDNVIDKHTDELQGVLINIHKILLQVYKEEIKFDGNLLSSREAEILYWCTTGKTYPEVANILQITVSTVKFHMAKVVKKMGVKNAKHAISLGIELNLISRPSEKSFVE
ncbi:LuxR family transcriptional regulator [Enterobacter bugandensis]|uniref:helix-turn-helix transcriptional regulator n=2 Tax=Enterobacter bugandensis TaxID=881260 RepID=UPI0010A3890B|nr:LuxR family transcriptional regulator [Enterobacter bugandensis]THE46744.1 LuxR family transcriptional regulator [Enterobacter bugandensis]